MPKKKPLAPEAQRRKDVANARLNTHLDYRRGRQAHRVVDRLNWELDNWDHAPNQRFNKILKIIKNGEDRTHYTKKAYRENVDAMLQPSKFHAPPDPTKPVPPVLPPELTRHIAEFVTGKGRLRRKR